MALLLSLALHVLLLLSSLLIGASPGSGQGEEQQGTEQKRGDSDTVEVELLAKPKEDPAPEQEEQDPEDGIALNQLERRAPHINDKCDDWYGGVGLVQRYTSDQVLVESVAEGYPAWKVGIRPGDVILNSHALRGEPGTPVTIKVSRDGEVLSFDVFRDKICTAGP